MNSEYDQNVLDLPYFDESRPLSRVVSQRSVELNSHEIKLGKLK